MELKSTGIKVLSLFNGISCGKLAFERAGLKVDKYVSYEIDDFANKIAQKHFPNDEYNGDVFGGDFTKYKNFDILIGGSPCTFWSSCRAKNTGREVTPDGIGGQLFMQYLRALNETNCKYFLYENNRSMAKEIKEFITEKLGVTPILINSSLVSGQVRNRLYWTNIPNVLLPKDKNISLMSCLDKIVDNKYYLSDKMIKYVMSSGTKTFYCKPEINLLKARPLTTAPNKRSGTTTYMSDNWINGGDSNKIRRLTPLECERLQTLPENYTYLNGHKFEDSKRYKAIGNGWTVDVVSHILSFLPIEYEENE